MATQLPNMPMQPILGVKSMIVMQKGSRKAVKHIFFLRFLLVGTNKGFVPNSVS